MVNSRTILLVNPACRDKRVTDQDDKVVPIGLYYIAALLMDNGFQAQILNLAEVDNDPVEAFKALIADIKPGIIGFSITNPSRLNAIECTREAKTLLPDTAIVCGGPAATFLTDHLFKVCPDLDYIVTGEGENTMLELARAIGSEDFHQNKLKILNNLNGLVFRSSNKIVKTKTRPSISELDSLPHPSKYFTFNHLAMSRGCPGRCTFCGSPRFWSDKTVRFHSPEWMADELQALVKKGITHFFISDDTFTMDKERVIRLCRLIREKKIVISWNAISRVDYIDEELVREMRLAGCIQISFGVESGSEKIRKTLGKPISREKIVQAFKTTISYGILPRAYFIYGSSGETAQTIQDSIDLIHDIKPLAAVFYMLVIFPGTHLYSRALKKGLVKDDIWHQEIEDLPWFEIDQNLSFSQVKNFGKKLRAAFYAKLPEFARSIKLIDHKELYSFHADFLSRLALTFSHGEYAGDSRINDQENTAVHLFEKALSFAPDARAFLGLGMILQKQKKFDQAVNILSQGISQFEHNIDLNTCMGVCLMNMGQFKSALTKFEALPSSMQTDHYINICRQNI